MQTKFKVMEGDRRIKYMPLAEQYNDQAEEIDKILKHILSEGLFINGPSVQALEEEIAKFCGVKYAVCLNSGTDALILGMKALGIGEGDEVLTPPNSFVASAASIAHCGARPVFVDVADDQNIDPAEIEKAITGKTKAIMPVHLTGRIAPMNEIKAIADKYNLFVIEDAAQSFGSRYYDKMSGSFGDVSCFSAHPLKNFNGIGDGGFVTTDNKEIAERISLLRNHGLVDREHVVEWGVVSRMDTFKAEILRFRLKSLPDIIAKRRENVAIYKELIDRDDVFIPECQPYEFNTFQTFVIQVDKRNELKAFLNEKGVDCSVHYPIPIHLQEAAKYLGYEEGDFPNTEKQAKRILSIPAHQYLTRDDIAYVSECINSFSNL
jgi:dTDP-4-amino-4,6-dideoxygalactose transaminase